MERKHIYDFVGWQADLLGLTREQYMAYHQANQIGLGIDESEFKGYLSGDMAKDIANSMSYYVKGIISQPNDNYTYLHLKNKSDASKVIKMLKDIYGLKGTDGGKVFWPSPTVKFSNDEILESEESED